MSIDQPSRTLFVLVVLALGASSACAEDFTGFYAGVNAGYAFDRSRDERGGPNALPDVSPRPDDAGSLPPSALTASQSPAMRGSRAERPPQR
ncbi:porin family protein [Methylobacterium haplocladii]|uniref:Outer membrane protein beta-barrel domain-containing protein n=1 Tax=Methylobacterium haplocladii TaxID=1176176 RepID=A0A512ITN9_9HYPH|nr:porin family protein [Methylobacterium haplocladii]GEP01009.1 hypothetical protein MHA02_33960 [Methylobacterium haplocladii]GJD86268.1 hypothetical protein HPGCJGGD_4172 [Methylobacterium haplocladii]GLS61157.1 hypothetical protein GCM10007887_38530 [Methylobacterium haplocladii]